MAEIISKTVNMLHMYEKNIVLTLDLGEINPLVPYKRGGSADGTVLCPLGTCLARKNMPARHKDHINFILIAHSAVYWCLSLG